MLVFNIKNIRKNKGISLKKLSNMTGISRGYLFDLENNRKFNPTLFILQKISEELEVNILAPSGWVHRLVFDYYVIQLLVYAPNFRKRLVANIQKKEVPKCLHK